ncbi:neuralized pats1, partial [Mytilus galloprovincialis]
MTGIQGVSESIFTKLRQLDRDDFPDLVAQGTFASYENRVYLAGPCNIGKSSLASILIGEAIPKTWVSTDGLIIHFGRNGIDLQQRKMIPLKKGSGDVLTKLILGNPELKEQQRLLDESQKKQNDDERKGEFLGDPISNLTKNENQLHSSNTDKLHSSQQQPNMNETSRQTPSVQHPQMQPKSDLDTSRGLKQPIHTAHSIQDDLLEKIRKGSYMMDIAPSDLVDFGGQKSFDMTHQLFVQHKGTFILMFDGRKGLHTELEEYPQGDVTAASILEHWINSVLTYCTKSEDKMPRITFAATHSDKFSEDEKEKLAITFQEELTERFSSHKFHQHIMYTKVFFINATDKEDLDIDRLKDTLVDIAFQQSSWGQRMPIVWVPLDLQISDMRADGKSRGFLTCSTLNRKASVFR